MATDDDDPPAGDGDQLAASSSTNVRRLPGRPFQPGQPSPNPTGRPRTDARVRASLEALTPEAVRELKRLLKDPHTPRRVRASIAMYVIDRRLGKPTIAVGGVDGQPLMPSGPAPDTALAQLLDRIRARQAGEGASRAASGENGAPGAAGAAGRAVS